MKVKQLTEKEANLGKTCCFEIAMGGGIDEVWEQGRGQAR